VKIFINSFLTEANIFCSAGLFQYRIQLIYALLAVQSSSVPPHLVCRTAEQSSKNVVDRCV